MSEGKVWAVMQNEKTLDWKEYMEVSRELVSEGCILLENRNAALPIDEGSKVSVFGRIQTHYYKSGTGSGGMVNVTKVYGILDGLKDSGIVINEGLLAEYEAWEAEHPFDEGVGWGTEPWSQPEMPLTKEQIVRAREFSDTAIVIIGRTAGEDKDIKDIPGAYRLAEEEIAMLDGVRAAFPRMIVLLNIGSLIDLNYFDRCVPDALMIVWQGGMVGGLGTADVLCGKASPSGKLTDTVAYALEDHPSHPYFGDKDRNFYSEDIFVGYRYFETFAKDKVRYPFGYGLSYTDFAISGGNFKHELEKKSLELQVLVKNTGTVAGKEVVQVYGKAPQGKLGKASRVLCGFGKTKTLTPGEEETMTITVSYDALASYDDEGATGYEDAFLLEEGTYEIFAGDNVRTASKMAEFTLPEIVVLEQMESALAPVLPMKRMKAVAAEGDAPAVVFADCPVSDIDEEQRRLDGMPAEIKQNFTTSYVLEDVKYGKVSMDDFIAQFTDDDLACIVRGEGMGSALVTPGTASAFGGVSEHLREMGIPCVCCDDGPSGMRLDSGEKAFSLPCGTMVAASFNEELTQRLYAFTSLEMVANKVECLLGPGMNIHRHPLNGRNFEYFSEDPFMTGKMAGACLRGLATHGVTGTVKHFCGNNQEYSRLDVDAVISKRALREIYLKGFEMIVRAGEVSSVMTTYGAVNGLWTAGNYDLNTMILRKQWGFEGIVMTDWWAKTNTRTEEASKTNFAAMVRAQNDLYMVCADSSVNAHGDNTMEALENGTLKRAELQRCAANICRFAMNSKAMERLLNRGDKVTIINGEKEGGFMEVSDAQYQKLDGEITIRLDDRESKAGTDYIMPLDIVHTGMYEVTLTGKSNMTEVAQMSCTLFYTGVPFISYTFHGTGGKSVSISKQMDCHNRFGLFRLNVGSNGLELESITFRKV